MSLSGSRLLRRIFIPTHCRHFAAAPVKFRGHKLPAVSKSIHEEAQRQVLEYAKTDRLEEAYQLLHDLYRLHQTPTIRLYNTLIKAHAKNFTSPDHQNSAKDLLRGMINRGIEPNTQTYMQLLLGDVAATRSDRPSQQFQVWFDSLLFVEARRKDKRNRTSVKIKCLIKSMAATRHGAIVYVMLNSVQANIRLDAEVWGLAIQGCSAGGRLAASEQLLTLPQCPSLLSVDTYAALIRAYLYVKDFDKATQVFKRMYDQGVTPNQAVYTSFLYAYSNDSNNQSEILQRLWKAMLPSLPPSAALIDSLLVSLFVHFERHGALPYAERMYWDLRHRSHTFTPTVLHHVQKVILSFAHRHELISVMSILYDLLAQEYWPSDHLVQSVIELCGDHDDLQAARQLLDILNELKDKHGVRQLKSDWIATLVRHYARIGDIINASDMYDTLLLREETPPPQATEAMVRAYFRLGEAERAETLWLQHQSNVSKECIVEGYARLGIWSKAKAFAEPETPKTHRILIQAHIELDDLAGAQQQLESALKQFKPSSVIAGVQAVMTACALEGRVMECEHWFQLLIDANVFMPQMFQALLLCYKEASHTDKIQPVYEAMQQRGFELEHGVYKYLQPWLPCI